MSAAPIRVLLVDDDEDDAVLTRQLLAEIPGRPYALDWVATFDEGLARIVAGEHDLYLVDYRLGPRCGVDLVRSARDAGVAGPLIVLTGRGDRAADLEAMEAGAADYLVKGRVDAHLLERSFRYALQRARDQADLRRHAEALARTNAELELFASAVSHDLRAPLQVMLGRLDLLAETAPDRLGPSGLRHVSLARDSVTRMNELIDSLLGYARLGTRARTWGTVALDPLLDDVLRDLEVALASSGAVVTREPLPTLSGNRVQLAQLLLNLVGNAVKFHRGRPPRVHVGARREGDYWHFEVRDEGIGFDPDRGEQIFGLFHRLQGADAFPGTGMGLAICKKVVDAHGGRIWAESQPGVGTVMHFTLPGEAEAPPGATPEE